MLFRICNNEKIISDREFIKLKASNNFNEHTNRLIMYYENFYPEHGIDLELVYTTVLHIHAFGKPGKNAICTVLVILDVQISI